MSDKTPVIKDPKEMDPYQRWITEVTYAEAELKKFYERGRRVVRRYVDERDAIDANAKWFNLFYANTKILKAAIYAQIPKPEVKRTFTDYNDQLARVGANILLRVVSPNGDDPRDTFDAVMRNAVLDRLLPGLAQAWCRVETDTEDVELTLEGAPYTAPSASPTHGFKTGEAPDEQQAQMAAMPQPVGGGAGVDLAQQGVASPMAPPASPPSAPPPQMAPPQVLRFKRITDQRICVDYVYWEDFLWSPCRVWEERRWVGRRVYMDRDALVRRFGEAKAAEIPLNFRPSNLNLSTYPANLTPEHQAVMMAVVYEIWDRCDRKIYWFCKDYTGLLDEKDDFLGLVGFEPCPKPLLANLTTSNTIPRSDFYLVQDQYNELDTLNQRIHKLTQACKVVGLYDASSDGVQRMLNEGVDNVMIPVDNWAMFAEKGGVKGQVDWLPLEVIVNALRELYQGRESVKAQIYELTGIADIVRGASKASETLGAQEIKAKFASVRIKDIQDEIALFASQLLRIKAELMVKHFDPEMLIRKSNILRTDDAPLAQEAVELLQSEEGFEWRIVVTSDQMAAADYAMEKQDRIELLGAIAGYLPQATSMIQTVPTAAPLLVNIMKWVISGFRGARDIEGMLDKELDNLLKQQQQQLQQPPKPTPEEQKTAAEIKKIEAQTAGDERSQQIKQQGMMVELKGKQMKTMQDLRANQMRHQQHMQQTQEDAALRFVLQGTNTKQ